MINGARSFIVLGAEFEGDGRAKRLVIAARSPLDQEAHLKITCWFARLLHAAGTGPLSSCLLLAQTSETMQWTAFALFRSKAGRYQAARSTGTSSSSRQEPPGARRVASSSWSETRRHNNGGTLTPGERQSSGSGYVLPWRQASRTALCALCVAHRRARKSLLL